MLPEPIRQQYLSGAVPGDQIADPAHLAVKEPSVQRLSVALFEQDHKLLDESIGHFDLL